MDSKQRNLPRRRVEEAQSRAAAVTLQRAINANQVPDEIRGAVEQLIQEASMPRVSTTVQIIPATYELTGATPDRAPDAVEAVVLEELAGGRMSAPLIAEGHGLNKDAVGQACIRLYRAGLIQYRDAQGNPVVYADVAHTRRKGAKTE